MHTPSGYVLLLEMVEKFSGLHQNTGLFATVGINFDSLRPGVGGRLRYLVSPR